MISVSSRLLVLYDADCGFCTRTARWLRRLDRDRRLDLRPLRDAAVVAPDAPPYRDLLAAIHVRDEHGRWSSAGAASLEILDRLPRLRILGGLARLPLVSALIEPVYRLVARHRQALGRALSEPACESTRLTRSGQSGVGPRRASAKAQAGPGRRIVWPE
jgi:predicted DCC family thiol-disulfide oxidoreductase YuxK